MAATLDLARPATARPGHVPEGLVYDFDMFFDPAYLADPHARVLDLVEKAPPIFWTPRNGGHWMLLSHAAVFSAARDHELFSAEIVPRAEIEAMRAALPPGYPHIPHPVPINIDPPEHAKYRAPLQAVFSPKSVLALKGKIRELAGNLLDQIRLKGRSEFMADVAEPLPVQVFLEMFGLPVERQLEYRALVKEHLADLASDPGQALSRMANVNEIMREVFIDRRENPRDDIISLLWKAGIDGREATLDDMENFGIVLFLAGLDTVMNGIGLGVRHLAMNPELQRQLRDNPKLIPEAAEELLRRYTFTVPPRRVVKDLVFEGVEMRQGERAMLFLPAADLDPQEFPDSGRYDLNRENNVHIAFGTGPHRCLGSHLARVEMQVLYEELLARLPEFRLDPDKPPTFHGGHVIGPETLPIIW